MSPRKSDPDNEPAAAEPDATEAMTAEPDAQDLRPDTFQSDNAEEERARRA